jgi:ABC-type transporter Mla subunit MlaD
MPVQDLTPQLRTRLSRVERVVGLFVTVASLLLVAGFGYYVYHTGKRKGWWTPKYRYYTFTESGTGLKAGEPVKLLGFEVGRVTEITAMEPFSSYGAVYVAFEVLHPFEGYIWTDSKVKLNDAGFLGARALEIIPGGTSGHKDIKATYDVKNGQTLIWNDKQGTYEPVTGKTKGYWLPVLEAPAITERLQAIADQAQAALPGIFDLTNKLSLVLSNLASMTSNANETIAGTKPMLSNITLITEHLKEPKGSLGEWVLPTNLNAQLIETLASANVTLTNASKMIASTDTNVTGIATNLDATLINLANITSNLNQQVQSNTNLVKALSDIIVHADEMVQGLKHHWLLRSAFKEKKPEDEKKKDSSPSDPKKKRTTANPRQKAGKEQ